MAGLDRETQAGRDIRLLITDRCDRDCPGCYGGLYNMKAIPKATDEELSAAKRIFLSGGGPFIYSDPREIAYSLKQRFKNIKKVYVYTGAFELAQWLVRNSLTFIDGLTVSVKTPVDKEAMENALRHNTRIIRRCLDDNIRIYLCEGYEDTLCPPSADVRRGFKLERFTSLKNSIFRRI